MSSLSAGTRPANLSISSPGVRFHRHAYVVRRSAPYEQEPGFYEPGQLWIYGNVRLLHGELAHIPACFGPPVHRPVELDQIERTAEEVVLSSKILVCGIQSRAHRRAATVPLRWGCPRILVFSGGFRYHLGPDLTQEPFPEASLWRESFDARTDLVISRRAPDKLPTYSHHNPTVDRLIRLLAEGQWVGLNSPVDPLTPFLTAS